LQIKIHNPYHTDLQVVTPGNINSGHVGTDGDAERRCVETLAHVASRLNQLRVQAFGDPDSRCAGSSTLIRSHHQAATVPFEFYGEKKE
jgi:hypothetical protein